ncbi:50S ribosomal protein L13 [Staphylothermus hellenicus]|uniref:Large ribosomal subunit protein uL13 n=1 Tax=Staphylothermus hellenicus (strain DSM 12710 / JCM 10830 / BK20S6-10-b1 / P8) TaxID=591019 RepID=D7DAD9_STAHD|nr:50S ribosomal protein L13 [Staphylothermus hellenicus]ADI32735.1 ribosomal protein L13 [Staphylothermus hellenicus DSM 12710]
MSEHKTIYVDATNQILGRLASIIAKKLLNGYRVIVVNAEKAVVSGERVRVIHGYKLIEKVTTHYNPYKTGIRRPRSPHNILKRTVRGMLPMDKPKGRNAYKRLRVYNGVPPELGKVEFIRFKKADANRLGREYITLADIAKELGWKGVKI